MPPGTVAMAVAPPSHRVFFGNIEASTSEATFIDTVEATAGPISHLKSNKAQPSLGCTALL